MRAFLIARFKEDQNTSPTRFVCVYICVCVYIYIYKEKTHTHKPAAGRNISCPHCSVPIRGNYLLEKLEESMCWKKYLHLHKKCSKKNPCDSLTSNKAEIPNHNLRVSEANQWASIPSMPLPNGQWYPGARPAQNSMQSQPPGTGSMPSVRSKSLN